MILDSFDAWKEKVRPDVAHVSNLLKQAISDEPSTLIQDLTHIEVWNARIGFILAEANSFLDRATFEMMPDEGTALEKKAMVESRVAPIRETRDKIEALMNAIKQRLILGESILGFQKQFADPRIQAQQGGKFGLR